MFSYLRCAVLYITFALRLQQQIKQLIVLRLLQQKDCYTKQCQAEMPCLEWGAGLDCLRLRPRHAQGDAHSSNSMVQSLVLCLEIINVHLCGQTCYY